MAAPTHYQHTIGLLGRHIAALSIMPAALSFMARAALPASAQTPILVTNPDGSVNYVTPLNGTGLVNSPFGGSYYVTANSSPTLVTNPNGGASYANLNGAPSLVTGPDGSLSYQYVVAGTAGWGSSSLGYLSSIGTSTPPTGGSMAAGQPLVIAGSATIPAGGPKLSGRYCDLPEGGQVWIADGAPPDGASC